METQNLVNKKYRTRTFLFMGSYAALNLAAIAGTVDSLPPVGAWVFSLAVSVPIMGQIWTHLRWMRDSDEFIRIVSAKRFIIATGIAMAVASTWGFLEVYAGARHLPAMMVFPLFYGSYGIVSPFIRTSH